MVLLYVECMAFFITEKEIEDYLILTTDFTSKQLVELAVLDAEEMGYPFEESFPNMLAYVHREARKAQGIGID